MINLPNLGLQFINIVTELCGFCTGLLGLEMYYNRKVLLLKTTATQLTEYEVLKLVPIRSLHPSMLLS